MVVHILPSCPQVAVEHTDLQLTLQVSSRLGAKAGALAPRHALGYAWQGKQAKLQGSSPIQALAARVAAVHSP